MKKEEICYTKHAILKIFDGRGMEKVRFRPCIDIHNGRVKQIIGGSLRDQGDSAAENFVAGQDAAFFAKLYREKGLVGGHVILLNSLASEYYEETKAQALNALQAYPGGLQIGGGMNPSNGEFFLKAGASHVIVTSYVFQDGRLREERLKDMLLAVGRDHLVLDLSCRRRDGDYYIVTDRWQKYTNMKLDSETIAMLSECCAEFLIHAVDVEGKAQGMEEELVELLGKECRIPATYAGGIHNFQDLQRLKTLGKEKIDFTIGSALDLFGGAMKLEDVLGF